MPRPTLPSDAAPLGAAEPADRAAVDETPTAGCRRRRCRRGTVAPSVPAGRGGGRHPEPGAVARGHAGQPRRPGLPRPHRAGRRLRLRRGPDARVAAAALGRSCAGSGAGAGFADRGERGAASGRGRHVPAAVSRRRRARPDHGAGAGGGGLPVERGHHRAEARQRRRSRDPARSGPRHRPLRGAAHRHRARGGRPGAARRRARRLLRHHRDDARARRPLRRARRLRPRDVPGCRRPRPLLAGPPRRRARARRARRACRAPRGRRGAHPRRSARRVRVGPHPRAGAAHVVLAADALVDRSRGDRGGLRRGARRPRHRATTARPRRDRRMVLQPPPFREAAGFSPSRAEVASGARSRAAELQIRSTTRLSAFLSHHLHTDARLRSLGEVGRSAVDSMSDSLRAPASLAFLGFLFIVVIGSRDLVAGAVPAIGTFGRWPSVGDLFNTFASAWRYTGLGSASPAPPALAIMGGLGTLLFGAVGLARTLVVVLAIPLGALGAYRPGPAGGRPARSRARRGSRVRDQPGGPQRDRARSAGPAGVLRAVAVRAHPHRAAGSTRRTAQGSIPAVGGPRRGPRRVLPGGAGPARPRRPRCCCSRCRSWAGFAWRRARSSSRSPRWARPSSCSSRGRLRTRAETSTRRRSACVPAAPRADRRLAVPFRAVGRRLGRVGAAGRRRGAAVPRHRPSARVDGAVGCWRWRAGRWCGFRCGSSRARRCSRPKRASASRRWGSPSRSGSACRFSSTASARSSSAGASRPRSSAASWPVAARCSVSRAMRWVGVGTPPRTVGRTRHWRSPSRSRREDSSGCCGWVIRRCCRSIRSSCPTAPAIRSPATAPATSPSSGARPSTRPTTSSIARSSSPAPVSPTAWVGCSRRWA